MTINVKVTLNGGVPFASQSLAANTASYAFNAATASFLSAVGLVPSASFANNSLIANVATLATSASSVNYSNITNLPTLISSSTQINTGSFSGSITNAISALSASYALTASFALNGGGGGASSSFSITSSFASSVPFGNISALPTLVSSSTQTNTGSFTGSFIGSGASLTGIISSSYAVTASNASSVQFGNVTAFPVGIVSSSGQISYPAIANIPIGIVSSSAQISTGSFTGSFIGNGVGITGVISSSYATSTSFAAIAGSIPFGNVSGLPTLVSSSGQVSYPLIANIPVGIVSSSIQINTGSFTGSFVGTHTGNGAGLTGVISSSYAITSSFASSIPFGNISALPALISASSQISYPSITNIPAGIVSSSAQVDTGSFTGSFIGTHTGNGAGLTGIVSSSYAITSSFALSIPFANVTALPTLVSNSAQISYAAIANVPAGIVSSSAQINTGSFTGSFTGNLIGTVASATSASFATTASAATSITFVPATASFALTAGTTGGGLTGNGTAGFHAKFTNVSAIGNSAVSEVNSRLEVSASTDITGSLNVTSDINALAFTGSGAGLLGVISSSYATTSSFASSIPFSNITALPTLVSASSQISYPSIANIPVGIVSSSGQVSYPALSNIPAGIVSSSTQISFPSISNIPAGLVSSSTQVSTGSFTGSFIGNGASLTGIVSSSYAVTSSFASSIPFGNITALPTLVSASSQIVFASISNIPVGLVSSSNQISTGTFTGSFIGNGAAVTGVVSSSYALTASFALNGGGGGASSSFATTASYASSVQFGNITALPTLVSSSTQISTGSFTGSFIGNGAALTGVVSSSFATTASAATSITFVPATASFATTASAATSITFIPATASFALSAGTSGGGVSGTGTAGNYAKFTGTSAIGNAAVSEVNNRVEVSASVDVTGSVNATSFTGTGAGITGVISSSYALSSSLAASSLSSSYFSGSVVFPNGLNVTGAVTASSGFNGDGSQITGVVSSSYALTASFALNGGGGGGVTGTGTAGNYAKFTGTSAIGNAVISEVNSRVEVSASVDVTGSVNATTLTGAGSGVTGVISSSYATTSSFASLAATGSYFSGTAGFPNGLVVTGSITASVGFNGDGSNITNIQYSKISGLPTLVSSSGQISYAGLTGIPAGIVSSSSQVNTGSFTGSFVGSLPFSNLTAVPTLVSSSGQITYSSISGIPAGIVSSSVQINTGSFTGSFVGAFTGTGAGVTGVVTASYALSAGATGGGVNGSGVTGFHAKFSAPTSLVQSAISEIGPVVEVSASMGITGSVTSSLGILAPNTNHAWGKILINANGSASLQQEYGISGFTTLQTGSWTITWSVPFSNANYCVQLTAEIVAGAFAVASTRTMYVAAGSQSAASMSVLCLDDTATTHLLKNPDAFHISAWGV